MENEDYISIQAFIYLLGPLAFVMLFAYLSFKNNKKGLALVLSLTCLILTLVYSLFTWISILSMLEHDIKNHVTWYIFGIISAVFMVVSGGMLILAIGPNAKANIEEPRKLK